MIIISIDVGIRNLAYVIIKIKGLNDNEILEWDVLELCEKNVKACMVDNIEIGENIKKIMNEKFNKYKFDKIIIENQIGKNAIKMKSIQGMLNMYFIMCGYGKNEILNYNERKKISKNITYNLCKNYYGSDLLNYYTTFKKKDDLADCLLQCLDYIKKQKLNDESFYLFNK
jgi:ABC-type antimicrobial peptide transport system permease subunit